MAAWDAGLEREDAQAAGRIMREIVGDKTNKGGFWLFREPSAQAAHTVVLRRRTMSGRLMCEWVIRDGRGKYVREERITI